MGSEIFLYLMSGNKQFVARVDPRTHAVIGEDIDLLFNMANAHFFDPKTEKALYS
jgi:multiple sugar transport system ATP-binding protein